MRQPNQNYLRQSKTNKSCIEIIPLIVTSRDEERRFEFLSLVFRSLKVKSLSFLISEPSIGVSCGVVRECVEFLRWLLSFIVLCVWVLKEVQQCEPENRSAKTKITKRTEARQPLATYESACFFLSACCLATHCAQCAARQGCNLFVLIVFTE